MKANQLAIFCAAICCNASALACDVIAPYPIDVTLNAGSDSRFPMAQPSIVSTTISENCVQDSFADNGQVQSLTNEQIDQLGKQVVLAPAWQASQVYVAGNRVSFQGVNYSAKWWTQGETPGAANSVWLADAVAGPQAWLASGVYSAGNQVTFSGKWYEAKWWNQNEQPGTDWGAWLLKGDAPNSKLPGLFSANIRKLADGQLVVSLIAMTMTKYTHVTDGKCGVITSSTSDWSGPFGTNWRINLDGVPAYSAPLPMANSSGTQPPPPPPPRLPNGECHPAGTVLQTNFAMWSQNVMAPVPPGKHRFLSVWSCSSDQQCRPSELFDFGFMEWAGPPQANYHLAN